MKILTAVAIPYAFFCAALFHLAFWSSFQINGLSFIDLSDIIKSSIQPIFLTFLGTIASLLLIDPITENLNKKVVTVPKFILYLYITSLIIVSFIPHDFDNLANIFWVPSIFIPASLMFVRFYLRTFITNTKIVSSVSFFIVLFPVFSFMTGKLESFKIKNNIKCQYSTSILPDRTLKFIGKAGSSYFFASTDNSEKFIIHDDKFATITLTDKK